MFKKGTVPSNRFVRGINLALSHPLVALKRLGCATIPLPSRELSKHVKGVLIDYSPLTADPRVSRKMFFGLYEWPIVATMKRFLRPGNVFVDVGANVGYLSAIGLGLVQETGEVHSFEPVPEYFLRLSRLATSNPEFKLFPNQMAASDTLGTSEISIAANNPGWNTMVPGFMPLDHLKERLTISTLRLDQYQGLKKKDIALVKIDTEGFELPALRGMENIFAAGQRPPIICEIAPEAYSRLGLSLSDLNVYVTKLGYKSRLIVGTHLQPVSVESLKSTADVLFTA